MATGGPSVTTGKEVDVRYTCCLCMEPYRGRSPKLLPCAHTFCLPCLTALEASVISALKHDAASEDDLEKKETPKQQAPSPTGDEGEPEAQPCEGPEGTPALKEAQVESGDVTAGHGVGDSRGSFLCPTCRAPVPIPLGGVAKLPTNFYVDHESDPDEDLPSVMCGMCEEDNKQDATHTCQQCQLNMCRSCRRCHDVLMRDHHVTPVGLGQPAKQKQEKKGVCLIHQDQVTCFYCRQCDVSICLHCKLTSHERHETTDLVSAALQAREEIVSLIPTAEQQSLKPTSCLCVYQLQVVEMALQQGDRQRRQLTRHVQEVTQQIQARCDLLVTWARQSRDRLVEEVSAKEACTGGQLQGQKASSTLTRDTLSSLLSRAARATAADPDVLLWRKELKAALLSEDTLLLHKQRADSQGPSWHWGYDVTQASLLLHEDDVTAYMGRVVEGADAEGKRRVPGSLGELRDRVEGWMREVTENTHTLTSQLASCLDDVTTLQKKGEEQEKETEELKKETEELKKETGELKKETGELKKETGELKKETGELKKKGEEQEKKTEELKKETGELKKETEELKKETEELKKKGEEQEKETGELKKEMTRSRKTEADLQKVTQSLKDNMGQGRTLFSVGVLNKDTTKKDQAMRFKQVGINDGGQFSKETSKFTAPHAGLYFFTAEVASNNKDTAVHGHIMVDNVPYFRVHGSGYGGSGSVMVPLTAGQTVWVKAVSPVGQYGDDWSGWNIFNGTLVLPFP